MSVNGVSSSPSYIPTQPPKVNDHDRDDAGGSAKVNDGDSDDKGAAASKAPTAPGVGGKVDISA